MKFYLSAHIYNLVTSLCSSDAILYHNSGLCVKVQARVHNTYTEESILLSNKVAKRAV